jgi:hypothetical protein
MGETRNLSNLSDLFAARTVRCRLMRGGPSHAPAIVSLLHLQ